MEEPVNCCGPQPPVSPLLLLLLLIMLLLLAVVAVHRTDRRHSMLELGSLLSRLLFPLSRKLLLARPCPAPAPAPASCPAPSISLTLCLLGTGGLLPFVTTPAFRMPFGPLTSSVVLPLLLVCFSFGLSDPEDR